MARRFVNPLAMCVWNTPVFSTDTVQSRQHAKHPPPHPKPTPTHLVFLCCLVCCVVFFVFCCFFVGFFFWFLVFFFLVVWGVFFFFFFFVLLCYKGGLGLMVKRVHRQGIGWFADGKSADQQHEHGFFEV